MEKKKTAFIYTRVSTAIQVDGYSLEAQKTELEKEAEHLGWRITAAYSDEGKSGKSIAGRPQFQQMMQDIRDPDKRPDYIMVFKLSRFGRNTADILNSLKEMKRYKVNLYCMKERIDSGDAFGEMMISLLGSIAQIERDNIRTQTMAGRVQKARDGKWNGGPAPYGYKVDKSGGPGNAKLVVRPEEAEVVKKIFSLYLEDHGTGAIAKMLNEAGYRKDISGKYNRRYALFSQANVKSILDNEVYMGYVRYGRTKTEQVEGEDKWHRVKQNDGYLVVKGTHEPLVDEDTWYKCHAKRKLNAFRREKTHSLGHEHILSGILKCPVCGAPMYGNVNRKKKKDGSGYYTDEWYYVCKHRKMIDGQPCRFGRYIRQDVINREVEEVIHSSVKNTKFMQRLMKRIGGDGDTSEMKKEVVRLEKLLKSAEVAQDKLTERIQNIPGEKFDKLYPPLEKALEKKADEISDLEDQLNNARKVLAAAEGSTMSGKELMMTMKFISDHFDEMSDAEERQVIRELVDRVEINEEPDEKGHWLKKVVYKVPVRTGKGFVTEVGPDGPEDDDHHWSRKGRGKNGGGSSGSGGAAGEDGPDGTDNVSNPNDLQSKMSRF